MACAGTGDPVLPLAELVVVIDPVTVIGDVSFESIEARLVFAVVCNADVDAPVGNVNVHGGVPCCTVHVPLCVAATVPVIATELVTLTFNESDTLPMPCAPDPSKTLAFTVLGGGVSQNAVNAMVMMSMNRYIFIATASCK